MGDKYQVAVEFSYDITHRGSNQVTYILYREDMGVLSAMETPRLTGERDEKTHLFYSAESLEIADEIARKARETGLVSAVHLEMV